MIKKLSKHGNSFGITIDKPILELLNINEKTTFRITTDGNNIILEPIRETPQQMPGKVSDDQKMQEIYEKIIAKYGPALKKLADK